MVWCFEEKEKLTAQLSYAGSCENSEKPKFAEIDIRRCGNNLSERVSISKRTWQALTVPFSKWAGLSEGGDARQKT